MNAMRNKIFAIIGALIAGGLGIAVVSLGPQAAHAGFGPTRGEMIGNEEKNSSNNRSFGSWRIRNNID